MPNCKLSAMASGLSFFRTDREGHYSMAILLVSKVYYSVKMTAVHKNLKLTF